MERKRFLSGVVAGVLLAAQPAVGFTRVEGVAELRRAFNLEAYTSVNLENVRVGILDKGFGSVTVRDTKTQTLSLKPGVLPPTTQIVENFSTQYPQDCRARALDDQDPHGGTMAQTAWAMTGNNPMGPQFYLLNANGLGNLACALRFARDQRIDVLLYSQNFEYGGDFNGKGFINALFDQATADGILVIVAAGNYGKQVYNGPVKDSTTLHLRSNYSDNPVGIRVSWSGTPEQQELGTDKDLDVEVYNGRGELLETVNYKQVMAKAAAAPPVEQAIEQPSAELELQGPELPAPVTAQPQAQETEIEPVQEQSPLAVTDSRPEALHPFEKFDLTLEKNDPNNPQDLYRLRIVKRGGYFNDSDFVRVTVVYQGGMGPVQGADGQYTLPVELLEATQGREIMVPADNPNVVTVGDTTPLSAKGPTMDGRSKPEVVLSRANVTLSSGRTEVGSSVAAAMMAGIAAQLKAAAPALTRRDLISFVESSQTPYSFVQVPREGSLPEGSQPVEMETVRNNHMYGTELVSFIEKAAPHIFFKPFVTPEGDFILAINQKPASLKVIFPPSQIPDYVRFDDTQSYEFYVAVRKEADRNSRYYGQMLPFYTYRYARPLANGTRWQYPWEVWADQGFARNRFVQIRYVPLEERRMDGEQVNNLWKTPTLSELKQRIARRLVEE